MSQTNKQNIKSFFNSWSTYDKVVHFNYMAHNEIFESLKKFFSEFQKDEFTILDLGCGDCRHIPATLEIPQIKSYTGVDISSTALYDAKKIIGDSIPKLNLIEDDFVNAIRSFEDNSFNLVIAGYSAHHLFYEKKQQFFDHCFRVLEVGGYFVHYDVQRLENETRNQYLRRYFGIIDTWEKLNFEERLSIKEHITKSDFPPSIKELTSMTNSSGFLESPGKLFADEYNTHALHTFKVKFNTIPMERKIREIINHDGPAEFRSKFLNNNRDDWHILVSSMDIIGDTTLAITNFRDNGIGSKEGEKYLRLHGILQAIFLQQDAIKFLYKTIKNSCDKKNVLKKWDDCMTHAWKEVRRYRNLITGHPVENTSYEKGKTKRAMISRTTISHKGFQLLILDSDNPEGEFKFVSFDLIDKYLNEANSILWEVEDFLNSLD